MSRFFLLLFIICASTQTSFAQTEQQSILLGGTASISYTSQKPTHVFSVSLNPNFGYFIINNLMLGFGLGIGISSDNTASDHKNRFTISSTFTPTVRYYFLKEKLKPFVFGRFGYTSSTSIHDGNIKNRDGITGGGGIGLDYFVAKNVALECTLGYNATKIARTALNTQFAIGLGLQYYFHPKIKPEMRP